MDLIIQSLLELGFRKYVFCIGILFQKELVEKILSYKSTFEDFGCFYKFSYERKLLGGIGAYNKALSKFEISNPVVSVPGDMFLPWLSFQDLIGFHLNNNCDVSVGLTDFITKHTTDIGKIWVDAHSKDIVKCLARDEMEANSNKNVIPLTSAGVYVVNPKKLKKIYRMFVEIYPEVKRTQIEMRDQLLPWLVQNQLFIVKGFNLRGEILDVGSYDRILYARDNWRKYTSTKR